MAVASSRFGRDPLSPFVVLYCPICQSPRVKRVAQLAGSVVCCCEACDAEFTINTPMTPLA
jgi:hypothetical protein